MAQFIPKNVEKALILLHGYGSNGEDMLALAQELDISKTAYFCPNAPIALPWSGYAWFPLDDFDMNHLSHEYAKRLTQEALKQVKSIQNLMTDIQNQYHLLPKNITLGGFSQGGLVAELTALQTPGIPVCVGMSAVPLFGQGIDVQNKPKIILTHGAEDFVVPLSAFQFGVQQLESLGLDVKSFISQNCEHGVNAEILGYLKSVLVG